MKPATRHCLLNGLLVVVSVIFALALVELTLRFTDLIPETDQANAGLVYDHSRSEYYKFKPNLHGIPFTGISLTSNQYGFRDRGMTLKRRAGVYRIAVMGDSWAFGWGVAYEKTFVRQLEVLLRERHPERSLELLNFSIPGHNMNEHFTMLRDEVLRFRPDHVVLFLHLNDIEVPVERSDPAPKWRLPELKTSRFLYSRLLLPLAIHWGISNPEYVKNTLSEYSPNGPYLKNYLRDVDGYIDLLRNAGIRLTVFLLPLALAQNHPYQLQPVNDRVKEIFAQRGVDVIELLDTYTTHTKDELIIHANDYHPNEFASRLLAEEIFRRFEERKLLFQTAS